ncbi:MAG TPA: hypothetical protein ACFE0H_05850 [Elainellaceae cyanobacterium]
MVRICIVVDEEDKPDSSFASSSDDVTQQVAALRQAIATTTSPYSLASSAETAASQSNSVDDTVHVDVVTPSSWLGDRAHIVGDEIVCPLTLNIPETLDFGGRLLYSRCRDVSALRQYVYDQWGYVGGSGEFWQPIVWTAKGPLYAEAIGHPTDISSSKAPCRFAQPFHLIDWLRQPLYQLGYRLLSSLNATPGTYLMQFGIHQQHLCFDRLYPFPAPPAIASIGVQAPDLFECHWRCLINQPILDVAISSAQAFWICDPAQSEALTS